MPDKLSFKASDNYRMMKTQTFNTPSAGTYNCIRIPKFAFVASVFLNITTACAGTDPEVTVGWLGNGETAQPAGFISAAIAECTIAGLKAAVHDTGVSWPGKYFEDAGGMLTITCSGTFTAGVFVAFVEYTIIV